MKLLQARSALQSSRDANQDEVVQENPAEPPKLRLFLLIGQSNMAGRGIVEAQDEVTHPRIWVLTRDLHWKLAKDPLHFDKSVAGVGLASQFARCLVKAEPRFSIGLIPCAVGGTSLDQWNPNGELFNQAVARAQEAMRKGTLAGILWHQGESDLGPNNADDLITYPVRFEKMISQLRRDLNGADVPLIVGELGRFVPDHEPFNAMLLALAKKIPVCGLVTSEELGDNGDALHFSAAALRSYGQRYAEAFLRVQSPGTKRNSKSILRAATRTFATTAVSLLR